MPTSVDLRSLPIHEIPLNVFISGGRGGEKPVVVSAEFMNTTAHTFYRQAEKIAREASKLINQRTPTNIPGFYYGILESDRVLCIWDESDKLVAWSDPTLVNYVIPEYRGMHLGRELTIQTFENGIKNVYMNAFFSELGLASRHSAHRFFIERAIKNGVQILPEVKESYEDFDKTFADVLRENPVCPTVTGMSMRG